VDTPKGGPFELVSYRLGGLPPVDNFLNHHGLGARHPLRILLSHGN